MGISLTKCFISISICVKAYWMASLNNNCRAVLIRISLGGNINFLFSLPKTRKGFYKSLADGSVDTSVKISSGFRLNVFETSTKIEL